MLTRARGIALERDRALTLLGEHQRTIAALLDEADSVFEGSDPLSSDALAHLRWQLVRRLRTYQLFKHIELFDPIMAAGDAERARSAGEMKARCLTAGNAYNDHVRKWTVLGMGVDPLRYRAEGQTIVARLREHLRREAADAKVLLERVVRTRR